MASNLSKVESSWIEVSPLIILYVKVWSNPIKSMKLIMLSLFSYSFFTLIVTKLCPVSASFTFLMNSFLNIFFDSSYVETSVHTISWITSFLSSWNEEMLIDLHETSLLKRLLCLKQCLEGKVKQRLVSREEQLRLPDPSLPVPKDVWGLVILCCLCYWV